MAAWCYFWRKVNGWTIDRQEETADGARLARRAVELGRDDAVALTRGGHALAHLAGDFDIGIALLDRAIFLNPNLASAWFLGGFLRTWRGEPENAIVHFDQGDVAPWWGFRNSVASAGQDQQIAIRRNELHSRQPFLDFAKISNAPEMLQGPANEVGRRRTKT